MIQRVQTLYLGIAAVMLIVTASAINRAVASTDPIAMAGMWIGGLLAVVSLGAIFLFSNRTRQRMIVRLTNVGGIVLFGVVGFLVYSSGRMEAVLSAEDGDFIVAMLACLVALVLLYRAASAIHRDILLVKSMDRIR